MAGFFLFMAFLGGGSATTVASLILVSRRGARDPISRKGASDPLSRTGGKA